MAISDNFPKKSIILVLQATILIGGYSLITYLRVIGWVGGLTFCSKTLTICYLKGYVCGCLLGESIKEKKLHQKLIKEQSLVYEIETISAQLFENFIVMKVKSNKFFHAKEHTERVFVNPFWLIFLSQFPRLKINFIFLRISFMIEY